MPEGLIKQCKGKNSLIIKNTLSADSITINMKFAKDIVASVF